MKQVRGVHCGSLKQISPVLRKWMHLMEDADWWKWEKLPDAPWWYNERALLSLFAGAIWRCKGWAFEEFAVTKRQKPRGRGRQQKDSLRARGDLEFWWPASDIYFISEAKRAELPIRENSRKLQTRIGAWLDACVDDVRRHPQSQDYRRTGILFVVPYLTSG